MKDHANAPSSPSSPRSPGRPRKPDALTPAQRAKAYRNQLNARGLTAVKCYLPPEAVAYLPRAGSGASPLMNILTRFLPLFGNLSQATITAASSSSSQNR